MISVELEWTGRNSAGEICGVAKAQKTSKCTLESEPECVVPSLVFTAGLWAKAQKDDRGLASHESWEASLSGCFV